VLQYKLCFTYSLYEPSFPSSAWVHNVKSHILLSLLLLLFKFKLEKHLKIAVCFLIWQTMQKLLSSLGHNIFLLRFGDLPLPRHMMFEPGSRDKNISLLHSYLYNTLFTGVVHGEIYKHLVVLYSYMIICVTLLYCRQSWSCIYSIDSAKEVC